MKIVVQWNLVVIIFFCKNQELLVYLLQSELEDIYQVLGDLGIVDQTLEQLILTQKGTVVGDIRHGVLMARSVWSRDLETGCADKDIFTLLLGRHCPGAV